MNYPVEQLQALQKHYNALKDRGSYDAFVRSAHDLLQRIGADPYHVRMALTRGKSMMEFGSRAAYRHSEGVGGIRVGLLMMEADVPLVPQELKPNVHYFQPRGETAYVKFTVPTWTDIPADLLALNEKAMRWEYARIKDTKLVEIRRGSGTDNEALRYAVVNGVQVSELRATQYWVFQGNPRFYDSAGALRAKAVNTWTVTAHLDRIQPGDKAIIWVTGQQAGCYALATITSAVTERPMDEADRPFVRDPLQLPVQKRVTIVVDHDLSVSPVSWADLRENLAMADFKGGSQGTTFTATKEQYDTILAMGVKTDERMSIPLNRIFYGPPGTGKTFHTVGAAVAVCDPPYYAQHKDDHVKLRERFNTLLIRDWDSAEGRIGFCTFHQSYSYEDFVEGIKPMVPEEGDKFVKYAIREGILKLMARRASGKSEASTVHAVEMLSFTPAEFERAEFYKLSLGAVYNKEDEEIYHSCIRNNVIAIGYMGQYDLTRVSEQEIHKLPLQPDQSSSSASQASYFRHYLKKGDYVIVTRGNLSVRAIGKVTGEYRYAPDLGLPYPHVRDVQWLLKDQDIPWEEIYTKKFVQRTIYKLIKEDIKRDFFVKEAAVQPKSAEARNFVLIIDEINRGNVAGIFGELITLIEENKRKGRPEALEVTLPYSQEPFSIPDNLYIIGTMNTADRSVEALDAALRRRFSFVPMMPEPAKLKPLQGSAINISSMLDRINARLVQLLDEDHQLGHSHFWDLHKEADPLPALRRVFKDKVIPQLEEYFHRDRAKLQLVLGERFVQGTDPADVLFLGDETAVAHEPRMVYAVTPMITWDESAFRSLYEKA